MNPEWIGAGMRLLPFIAGVVAGVERMCTDASGKAKQDTAVHGLRAAVAAAGAVDDAVLLEDPDVERATRLLINAFVLLQNTLARRAAPPAAP